MRKSVVFLVACLAGASVGLVVAQEKPKMVTGEILSLDTEAMTLVVLREVQGGASDKLTFHVEPSTVIRIHGPRGKLGQLKAGDMVTVRYSVRDSRNIAIEITHM